MVISQQRLEEKLWEKINKYSGLYYNGTECWLWTGAKYSNNYGHLTRNGKDILAHKLLYEKLVGPIDKNLTIDHLCKNKPCVNPAHLEQVTMRINLLRSNGMASINSRKTHCPKGHEYTEDNTYARYGQRYCKTCMKARNKNG